MFNRNLFRAAVIRKGYNLKAVADYLTISEPTLYRKMNGESDFTRAEIGEIKGFLDLSIEEADAIFFCKRTYGNVRNAAKK